MTVVLDLWSDGWRSENVLDQFKMELAKAATTGDLLEGVRAQVNHTIGRFRLGMLVLVGECHLAHIA